MRVESFFELNLEIQRIYFSVTFNSFNNGNYPLAIEIFCKHNTHARIIIYNYWKKKLGKELKSFSSMRVSFSFKLIFLNISKNKLMNKLNKLNK